MGNKWKIHDPSEEQKECEYMRQTYFEYDTGYAEYDCDLIGSGCMYNFEYGCPLTFKYKVEEQNE